MIVKLYKSFIWSCSGIYECCKAEKSFQLELLLLIINLFFCFYFDIASHKTLILTICILLTMIVELLNSGIEKLADLVTKEHNELVAYAKNAGSASVFLSLIIYVICLIVL